MTCDGGESVHAAQQNHTSTTPFHRFDASLFYSSPQSGAVSDVSASATAGGGIYDQYRVDTPDSRQHARPSPSPVFTLTDVTEHVDADLLRAVFLLSDLVVLVYRLTATYVTVRALRRRFNVCSVGRRPPRGQPAGPGGGGQLVADGGSTLKSSSSRTALTSTSGGTGVGPDASNIYMDPQSLVVENCATLVHRPAPTLNTSTGCPRRRSDITYSSGQLKAALAANVE